MVGGVENGFHIAGLRAATRFVAADIDERQSPAVLKHHRSADRTVEPRRHAFVGVQHRDITRRETPKHTGHRLARIRHHRRIAASHHDKAIIRQPGHPQRHRIGRMAPHQGAAHVGPISKIQRHGRDIAMSDKPMPARHKKGGRMGMLSNTAFLQGRSMPQPIFEMPLAYPPRDGRISMLRARTPATPRPRKPLFILDDRRLS